MQLVNVHIVHILALTAAIHLMCFIRKKCFVKNVSTTWNVIQNKQLNLEASFLENLCILTTENYFGRLFDIWHFFVITLKCIDFEAKFLEIVCITNNILYLNLP